MRDQALAPLLVRRITRLRQQQRARKAAEASFRASEAARVLGETARHRQGCVVIDPAVLLGGLTADGSIKYIVFEHEESQVAVSRERLHRIRRVIGQRRDLAAHFDAEGVHLRWKGGRAGLNLRPQLVDGGSSVLLVPLHPPAAPPPTPEPQRRSPRRPRAPVPAPQVTSSPALHAAQARPPMQSSVNWLAMLGELISV